LSRIRHDLTNNQYGNLTVVNYAGLKGARSYWNCSCSCGRKILVRADSLLNNRSTSCGCLRTEKFKESKTTHGLTYTRFYKIWRNMIDRCENNKHVHYKDYGGRGIEVCREWHDLLVFKNWADTNGYSDNLTIDRIDNSKGYNPNNCQWTTQKEQVRNTRRNRFVTYCGQTKCVSEWAEILKINTSVLWNRLFLHGWTIERAFTTPLQ
jgi:hypothetical protein